MSLKDMVYRECFFIGIHPGDAIVTMGKKAFLRYMISKEIRRKGNEYYVGEAKIIAADEETGDGLILLSEV